MEKKPFRDEYEKIEVPQEDVLKAIQTGIGRASLHKVSRRNNRRRKPFILSAAAAIFISSSFIVPSMSQALAEVPLIGTLYTNFNDLVGRSLASQQLITELNASASHRGIDVTVTSAYYDGAVVGVTFHVKGDVKTESNGRLMGFYEIFDGDDGIADSKELVYLDQTDGGFVGNIRLNYPKTELPPNTTFPLEFKRLGNKEGTWKFDVPIKQLAYEERDINEERSNIKAEVNVLFDSIIHGEASTAINYTASFPLESKNDQVRLDIFDDQGNEINVLSDGIDLETHKFENHKTVKGRTVFAQSLIEQTSYIVIEPKVAINEKDHFVLLAQPTPYSIQSNRQNLSVDIEKMEIYDKKFIVDFQVNSGERGQQNLTFFKNYAKNNLILVKETEKEVYEEPMKHTTEVLDEEKLRFRSTFEIGKVKSFNPIDYVLRVSLSTLSSNMPVELDSVKIDLQ
ncbi:DUF4179 domain-containing protein [Solibacillus sp. R5-41]|uniref:DUF4179 domain-containing protein n=1 Tax=Solibacillus sp. R5-41 TaxID=2048654 RepID=UPI000C126AE2|nr:DUF4179 domain-containing protein [Solibacillus sp. R5-41]ATP40654.1 DUF4179 domain-containing protein [Solibacillus sp. R5-41]